MKGMVRRKRISLDLRSSRFERSFDMVALDAPLEIFLNGERFTALLATPSMTEELVVGHLISEGIVRSLSTIEKVDLESNRAYVDLAGSDFPVGGALPRVESNVKIDPKTIMSGVSALGEEAKIFPLTGGTHAAALYGYDGELLIFVEDVGRHNTFDKAIGHALMNGKNLKESFITSTARQSGSMVSKVARSGIPLIAARSAPMDSGISIAESTGITLICFAREDGLNIYTHPERVPTVFETR